MSTGSFTGKERRRETRVSVKFFDKLARLSITVGGIGTILAVTAICVFLIWVVIPLFLPAELVPLGQVAMKLPDPAGRPLRIAVDEYRVMSWVLTEDAHLKAYRLDDGALLSSQELFPGRSPTAISFAEGSHDLVVGFADGTVVLGTIGFTTKFFDPETFPGGEVPSELRDLEVGHSAAWDGGMVQLTPEGQYRQQRLAAEFEDPTDLHTGTAVRQIDLTIKPSGPMFAALTEDGKLLLEEVRKRHNLMLDKWVIKLVGGEVDLSGLPQKEPPHFLCLSGLGDHLYLVWEDGLLVRYNTADLKNTFSAETVDLFDGDDARVSRVRFMNGKTTLLVGDTLGRTRAWFPVKPDPAETPDGSQMVMAHVLPGPDSPVSAFGPSVRTQLVTIAYENGAIRLYHTTSRNLVAETADEAHDPLYAVAIAPKDNGVVAASAANITRWDLDSEHPDATLSALFTRVWYEGYERPEHVWQSTGGTDDFEPKLGMMPLIFGTLKGTLYSMLFGLPLALLAAIFASEFLSPKVKARVKPTVEVMASLPSVVLGFLAALVIAPFIEDIVPACLACFITVPFAFLIGAYFWQLLPQDTVIRLSGYRFLLILLCVPVGVALGALVGPLLEDLLFAGDIKTWLDGQAGDAWGGWMIILLPLSALLSGFLMLRVLGSFFQQMTADWDRHRCAQFDIVRFALTLLLGIITALVLALLLSALGLDPRGSVFDTYVQRNALVVGFVMGFAIIPIIFTIAEDALAAVPDHLRSASLGAGATPWQTATRIVIPTAMSGLFSATMIGLGRAVGETMIVLMAAGNTPIMEWSLFNGFRTLSANLAVELPEAPINSTHYRTLFLAGLVLFLMTFVVNTVAESVRQRFRKRAFEL